MSKTETIRKLKAQIESKEQANRLQIKETDSIRFENAKFFAYLIGKINSLIVKIKKLEADPVLDKTEHEDGKAMPDSILAIAHKAEISKLQSELKACQEIKEHANLLSK